MKQNFPCYSFPSLVFSCYELCMLAIVIKTYDHKRDLNWNLYRVLWSGSCENAKKKSFPKLHVHNTEMKFLACGQSFFFEKYLKNNYLEIWKKLFAFIGRKMKWFADRSFGLKLWKISIEYCIRVGIISFYLQEHYPFQIVKSKYIWFKMVTIFNKNRKYSELKWMKCFNVHVSFSVETILFKS